MLEIEELELLSKKHGREVVIEIGKVFLSEIRLWQEEYATAAMDEAVGEAIDDNSVIPLLKVKSVIRALSIIEESMTEFLEFKST